METEELLQGLNAPQAQAVQHGDGPLLVLAGAGSGKTRVLTHRIAYLVQARGVSPWSIVAVTFTNKAAREMRERLERLLGPLARDLTVSTFHSAAAQFLRRDCQHAGLERNFVIYDDSDQLSVMKRVLRTLGEAYEGVKPTDVLHKIDQAKNSGIFPEEFVTHGLAALERVKKAYQEYQRMLRAANAVDFGDLLMLWVRMLERNPLLLEKYQLRFQHVLVDEFQDTNHIQYRLLKLLAPPGSSVMVVGDDDQSIYSWRGAEVSNILDFPKKYPGCTVVKLEQNYRSDQTILSAANAVISHNSRRLGKNLFSARAEGAPLDLILARDERAEAEEVAQRCHQWVRQGLCGYQDIAVFYRTNAQSRVLEEAMRLQRVPYAVVAGRSFYERAEIRDAAAYLRLMVNPASDADCLRIINTPGRGIGETTVQRLSAAASERGLCLMDMLRQVSSIGDIKPAAQKKLVGFRSLLEQLYETGQHVETATEAAQAMLTASGLLSALDEEGSDESEGRAENLRELLSATQSFDQERAKTEPSPDLLTPLESFLEHISLVGDVDGAVPEGRVSLMTLHAAKGLEFEAVFLTGLEQEVFPHRRATHPESPRSEMEEERRLCYVGFTRARRRLCLSMAQMRTLFGETRWGAPSQFLREVPKELFADAPPASTRPAARAPSLRVSNASAGELTVDRSYDQSFESGGDLAGMRVYHEQLGVGVIVGISATGGRGMVSVRFEEVGMKSVQSRHLTPL